MPANWPPSNMSAPLRPAKQVSAGNAAKLRRQAAQQREAEEKEARAQAAQKAKRTKKPKAPSKPDDASESDADKDQLEPLLEAALREIEQQSQCWWQASSAAAANTARRANDRATAVVAVEQKSASARGPALFHASILHSPVRRPLPSPRLMPMPAPRSDPPEVGPAGQAPPEEPALKARGDNPWWWPQGLQQQEQQLQRQPGQPQQPASAAAAMKPKQEWEERRSKKHRRPYWVERYTREVVWRDPHKHQPSRAQQPEPEPEPEPEPAAARQPMPPTTARQGAATAQTVDPTVAAARQKAVEVAVTPFRMLAAALVRPPQPRDATVAGAEEQPGAPEPGDTEPEIDNEEAIAKIQAVQRGRQGRAKVAQMRAEAEARCEPLPAVDPALVAQLISAADKGDTAAVADLLGTHKVPVNSTADGDGGGGSALQYSAQKNHTKTVREPFLLPLYRHFWGLLFGVAVGGCCLG